MERNKRLSETQQQIDEMTYSYIQKDFDLKHENYKNMAGILGKRDAIIKDEFTSEERTDFYRKVFTNFEVMQEYLPAPKGTFDCSFIKFLRAEYCDGNKMKVTLELEENEYVQNQVLEKTIHLYEEEAEATKIQWKDEKGYCALFEFFESEEDDMESFDIFYEFYVNMIFLYELELE